MSFLLRREAVLVTVAVAVVVISYIYVRCTAPRKQNHWQRSTEGRNETKETRLKLWGRQKFPADYRVSEVTRKLFTNYATLIGKSPPSDEEIVGRIRNAYDGAIETFPYRCIYATAFATPGIVDLPFYSKLLEYKELSELRFLEIGACMGTDIRHLITQGVDQKNVMGLELEDKFIDLGIQMFSDKPSMRSRFQKVNILTDNFEENNPALKSFVDDGVDAVYTRAVYHLFCEEDTYKLTKACARLLRTGGIFVGGTGCSTGEPMHWSPTGEAKDQEQPGAVYLHSVKTFKAMLSKSGFTSIEVALREPKESERKEGQKKLPGGGGKGRGNLHWYAIKA